METIFKKCLYCDNMTSEPHFQSGCCLRGMCEECYQGEQGTEEQFQIDFMEDEDYNKYIKGTKFENYGYDYICFNCVEGK